MSTAAHLHCSTPDYKNVGKTQQNSSRSFLITQTKLFTRRKRSKVFRGGLSYQKFRTNRFCFFTQIFVIAFVDLFLSFKLPQTSWTERSSEDTHATTVCKENFNKFTISSTTLGFILPPPKSNSRRVNGLKGISNANGQEQSIHFQGSQEEFKGTKKERGGDGGSGGADETDCEERKDSSDSAPNEIWYCVCLGQSLDNSKSSFSHTNLYRNVFCESLFVCCSWVSEKLVAKRRQLIS